MSNSLKAYKHCQSLAKPVENGLWEDDKHKLMAYFWLLEVGQLVTSRIKPLLYLCSDNRNSHRS